MVGTHISTNFNEPHIRRCRRRDADRESRGRTTRTHRRPHHGRVGSEDDEPPGGAHEARAKAGRRGESWVGAGAWVPVPRSDEFDYEGYASYIDTKMPKESPPLFGLHPNAEIGYLTSSTANLFSRSSRLAAAAAAAAARATW